jgi:DNA-binding response OmpR family regulator
MKILVADDDRVLADLISFTVRRAGYESVLANDVGSTLRRWKDDQPDLILLDVNLPGTSQVPNGFAVCQHIRKESEVPIVLLTVRGEEEDIVHGLEIGADDYILKPFSPRQLVARIKAILRRGRLGEQVANPAKLSIDGLNFNPRLREVQLADGTLKSLTSLESQLLENLMFNAGQILTTDDLISDVWGATGGSADMLRQLVRRLRTKIESNPADPYYITNHPGIGYAFRLKRG